MEDFDCLARDYRESWKILNVWQRIAGITEDFDCLAKGAGESRKILIV